jgi:hypothetical protein
MARLARAISMFGRHSFDIPLHPNVTDVVMSSSVVVVGAGVIALLRIRNLKCPTLLSPTHVVTISSECS